jgi:D-3-phosphoglycerate dehydrogenase
MAEANMKRVLVVESVDEAGLELLRARPDIEFEVITDKLQACMDERIQEFDGVTLRRMPLPAHLIDKASRLRVVSRHGVGYDAVDVSALTRRGIPLTIVGDANAATVAEHVFFMMLSLARKGFAHDRATRDGDFTIKRSNPTGELLGKTLLIIGVGRVGRQVAKRCVGFGFNVLAYDPFVDEAEFEHVACRRVENLEEGLRAADVVTLHVPRKSDTVNMIDQAALAVMKPTAFLINAARGGIVDEAALFDALTEGRLAGAGLDTFAEEPTKADHPLFTLDNVIVSPHGAAAPIECEVRSAARCIQNVLDAFDGTLDREMVVNPEVLRIS